MSIRSSWPAPGATGVSPVTPVTLQLSGTLPASSPPPRLSPDVAGRWARTGARSWVFHPSDGYALGARVSVSIDMPASAHTHGRRPDVLGFSFQVGRPSVLLAQELLAQLGYLPVRLTEEPGLASRMPSFQWRWPRVPAQLEALWTPGVDTVLTQGAVIAFERVHHLRGTTWPAYAPRLTAAFWHALVLAAANGQRDPHRYSYVLVTEEPRPELLHLYVDGAQVLSSLANTGVPGAATPTGSYAIYLRYARQTLRGTSDTGQPYVYPNIPYVNYFSGSFAIHEFPRAAYGSPQSQGCIELPLDAAADAWGDLHYGSVVIITGS